MTTLDAMASFPVITRKSNEFETSLNFLFQNHFRFSIVPWIMAEIDFKWENIWAYGNFVL